MKHPPHIAQVAEFHAAFQYRQPEPLHPDLSDSTTNKLRPDLIREEVLELHDAHKSGDRIGMLDACCDIQYVVSGAYLAWGFRRMLNGTVDMIDPRKIHDIEAHIVAMLGMTRQLETAAQLVLEMQTFTILRDLQSRLTKAVYHLGFMPCFEDAFAEVHRSNMSKIWSKSQAKDTMIDGLVREPTGMIYPSGVYEFLETDCGFIARNTAGKIIKSPSYSPAELGRFV